MRLKMFRALPPYFGGKRKLLGTIFRHVPPPAEAPVLADAFLGGGSVSLFAKARGYEVHCNDVATRSVVVGHGLIENDTVRLADEDVFRLLAPNERRSDFVERTYSPDTFTANCARFIDLALANAREVEGAKRSLALLLVAKFVFRSRPMGNFGAKAIMRRIGEGRWDEVNPNHVRESLNRRVNGHPLRAARAIAAEINCGVFSNGKRNHAYQLDVFEFLRQVEADAVYVDPPYAGTSSYESALRVADAVLAGEEVRTAPSVFSGKGGLAALDELLAATSRVPHVVLSYGNAETTIDDLAARVARHGRVVTAAREIGYAHCASLASEESRVKNRELIVAARKA